MIWTTRGFYFSPTPHHILPLAFSPLTVDAVVAVSVFFLYFYFDFIVIWVEFRSFSVFRDSFNGTKAACFACSKFSRKTSGNPLVFLGGLPFFVLLGGEFMLVGAFVSGISLICDNFAACFLFCLISFSLPPLGLTLCTSVWNTVLVDFPPTAFDVATLRTPHFFLKLFAIVTQFPNLPFFFDRPRPLEDS